jgi:hypothetical protein
VVVKYTIDRLDDDSDALIEVEGPDASVMQPMRGPGDRIMGWQAARIGSGVGRARLQLLSGDVELLDGKMEDLRAALRAFRVDQLDSNELEINGKPPEGPDEEAAARTTMEALSLLAYAALAIELETSEG